jgi:hypothetical protein
LTQIICAAGYSRVSTVQIFIAFLLGFVEILEEECVVNVCGMMDYYDSILFIAGEACHIAALLIHW